MTNPLRADSAGRLSGAALVFAALLLAASCATIPPTNYYVLGLPSERGHSGGDGKFPYAVSVAPFESEPVYLRKKIVWRSGSSRVGYYSYERWAALPAEMFAFRLYERARGSGLFKDVCASSLSGEADLILRGKIMSFEELDTSDGWLGRVEVKVELADADGAIIWSDVVARTAPASEESVEAAVAAIASATEAVITEILASVEQALEDSELQRDLSEKMGAHYFAP